MQIGTSETLSDRGPFLDQIANKAYEMVLENTFDRGDEIDADKVSVQLTRRRPATRPATLADFLTRLDERNKDQPEQQRPVRVASGDEGAHRQDSTKLAGAKAGATRRGALQAEHQVQPAPITRSRPSEGSAGLDRVDRAREGRRQGQERGAEEEGLRRSSSLKQTVAPEKQTAQVSASGGARGLGRRSRRQGRQQPRNREGRGLTDAEVAAFKKGMA